MSDIHTAYKELINWLKQTNAFIKDLDQQARKAAQVDNNPEGFNKLMVKRAETIKGMPAEAEKYIASLPAAEADAPRQKIQGFAQMAEKALSLNSYFFMSLLLLPQTDEEPNSLEVLVADLQKKIS